MKWKRFGVYSAFGWVVPVLIITGNLLAVFITNHTRNSWFNKERRILVFYVAPISIIMALNVVFFSWSASLVYSTKSKMENRSTARTQLCLFVRLFVVMGITWAGDLLAFIFDISGNVCT
jgi:formate hydrogenlyase subunit 3/multisubunit Na+/H+ antiporter MnhD subunit